MINETMSDLAVAPGEYLEEVLEEIEMTQSDLALRMGRPHQVINGIIRGDKQITPETALQLEQVLGVPASLWTNLEAEYRLVLAIEAERIQELEEQKLVPLFPYAEIAKLGFVKTTKKNAEKTSELKRFLGVSSLNNIKNITEYAPAFRQAKNAEVSQEALAAWLRVGHLKASERKLKPFQKDALKKMIPEIRKLSFENAPDMMTEQLTNLLADCGVALVIIPHFKKTFVKGATFWYSKNNPVVMMAIRECWSDIFWFSLFHELAHVILHSKKSTFIDDEGDDERKRSVATEEEEADLFAQETLIPPKAYSVFLKTGNYSERAIKQFADSIGIYAGIVTGRLQYDRKLSSKVNPCRTGFKWA